MNTKSNTKRIIEIWMKACFQKLMTPQTTNTVSDSTSSSPSTKGGGDNHPKTTK